jgi:hypothetical protein
MPQTVACSAKGGLSADACRIAGSGEQRARSLGPAPASDDTRARQVRMAKARTDEGVWALPADLGRVG